MNRAAFYAALRARASGVFGTSLSQKQVEGTEAILNEAVKRKTQPQQLAYILATTYHETAHTMQPIAEYGKGKGCKYGVKTGPYGHVYYGRGFVQLTWLANYEKAGKKLGVDLVRYPERAMELGIATAILFSGMEEGWFTGKKLADYIWLGRADYEGARRIINGTDKKALIADYARAFEAALKSGGYTTKAVPAPESVPAPPAPAPDACGAPAMPKAATLANPIGQVFAEHVRNEAAIEDPTPKGKTMFGNYSKLAGAIIGNAVGAGAAWLAFNVPSVATCVPEGCTVLSLTEVQLTAVALAIVNSFMVWKFPANKAS